MSREVVCGSSVPGWRAESVRGRAVAAMVVRLLCASRVTGGDHRLAGKWISGFTVFPLPNPKLAFPIQSMCLLCPAKAVSKGTLCSS